MDFKETLVAHERRRALLRIKEFNATIDAWAGRLANDQAHLDEHVAARDAYVASLGDLFK